MNKIEDTWHSHFERIYNRLTAGHDYLTFDEAVREFKIGNLNPLNYPCPEVGCLLDIHQCFGIELDYYE